MLQVANSLLPDCRNIAFFIAYHMENTGSRPVCSGTYRVLNTTTIICVCRKSICLRMQYFSNTDTKKEKQTKKNSRNKKTFKNTNNTLQHKKSEKHMVNTDYDKQKLSNQKKRNLSKTIIN